MQFLEAPAVGDQFRGEIVEEFRVRRHLALRAEITRRADQSEAKVVGPHAIHDYARSERIFLCGDRLGKLQASARVRGKRILLAAEERNESPIDLFARAAWIPADEYA